jgi:4-amino-4-deoxy-L-arabinose transferase-like glycosyltransferase
MRWFGGAALTLICLFLFFWRLGAVPLFDLDEGLYATCAKQMALSGDWVTPRLNSRPPADPTAPLVPFFEKPILIYWLAAASMRAFGISPWAARLPVALAALFTALLVAGIGARWFGTRAGLFAGLVYATAPITIVDARQLTTDGLLVLWFTVALSAFAIGQEAVPRSPGSHAAALVFWLACTLAVLTKGAVGLLLPTLVIGVALALDRLAFRAVLWRSQGPTLRFMLRLAPIARLLEGARALRPVGGLLLLLALAAPWHFLVWRAGGRDALGHTWVQEYVIRQHIGRFKGLDTVHNAPLPSYFVFFLIGFFPWACLAPAAFRKGLLADPVAARSGSLRPYRLLLAWFWTIFIFFSVAAAKLPTYIAPAYPAAALLTGRWLDRLLQPRVAPDAAWSLRRGAGAAFATALLLMVVAVVGPRFAPRNAPIPADVQALALHLTGLLALGCGAAWIGARKGAATSLRTREICVGLLVAMLLFVVGIGCTEGYGVAATDILSPYQSAAAAARPDAERGVPVIFYDIIPRRPSMNFYAGYSPLERKEEPLLPFLRPSVPAGWRQVDVVTSSDVYDRQLLPELAAHPDLVETIRARRGGAHGWVVVTVTRPDVDRR